MLKNPAFWLLGSDLKLDEKYAWINKILGMPMAHLAWLCYPRIYKISDIDQNDSYGYIDEYT